MRNLDLNNDLTVVEGFNALWESNCDTIKRGSIDMNTNAIGWNEEFEEANDIDMEEVGTVVSNNKEVVGIVVPTIGMIFGSWDEVDDSFNRYGKQEGFGVLRAANSRKRSK